MSLELKDFVTKENVRYKQRVKKPSRIKRVLPSRIFIKTKLYKNLEITVAKITDTMGLKIHFVIEALISVTLSSFKILKDVFISSVIKITPM